MNHASSVMFSVFRRFLLGLAALDVILAASPPTVLYAGIPFLQLRSADQHAEWLHGAQRIRQRRRLNPCAASSGAANVVPARELPSPSRRVWLAEGPMYARAPGSDPLSGAAARRPLITGSSM